MKYSRACVPSFTTLISVIVIILSNMFIIPHVSAELSPSAYLDMAKKAPEVIDIIVNEVKTSVIAEQKGSVHLKATVLSVKRSATDLKSGDLVSIDYEINHRPLLGPKPPFILKKGQFYRAFLKKNRECYQPVIFGRSFTRVSWQRLKKTINLSESTSNNSTKQ